MLDFKIDSRLKNFIKKEGITQQKLADRTGKSLRTVQSYCNGKSIPDADFLADIKDAYNLNINWLLAGDEPMYIKPAYEQPDDQMNQVQEEGFKLGMYLAGYSSDEIDLARKILELVRKRPNTGRIFHCVVEANAAERNGH